MLICVLVLVLRPWQFMVPRAHTTPKTIQVVDTVPVPINQIVQNSDSDIPQAERFDKTVESFLREWQIEGASLAIMKDGNLIYSKGYGLADKASNDSVEVRHLFRVASVSKLITAVGIMHLVERGLLSLNSTVFGPKGIMREYNNYTDKRVEKITIENLLRHQGGFSIRAGDPAFDGAKMGLHLPLTPKSLIEYALSRTMRYAPGARTAYSNVGYVVLSQVIEHVTARPYEGYIRDSILAPIGCFDMHIGHSFPNQRHPNEVSYYEVAQAEDIPSCDGSGRMVPKSSGGNNIELLEGAGGWVASPVEMLRLVAAIDSDNSNPKILTKKSIRQMTEYSKGYLPFGWIKVNEQGDWWRSGTMAGTSAMLRRQANGYTWMMVTNTSSWKGARFSRIINSMLQRAFGKVSSWPDKDMFQMSASSEDN
ncbi:MAG: serine hydrolase domain-containing protein [Mucinivorans sp.]